jgi:hypothetical protein
MPADEEPKKEDPAEALRKKIEEVEALKNKQAAEVEKIKRATEDAAERMR